MEEAELVAAQRLELFTGFTSNFILRGKTSLKPSLFRK